MTSNIPRSAIRILALAALCSTSLASRVAAEPVTVTSGQFTIGFDNPTAFRFFAQGGFELSAIFVHTSSSPQQTCLSGCAPGTSVDMSAVAGGDSAPTEFPLGLTTGAVIGGVEFLEPFGVQPDSPWLTGTLRFDAPTIVLPPFGSPGLASAPFIFSGEVTGFARNDLEGLVPLFNVTLAGQGIATIGFEDFVDGVYREPITRYTFAPASDPVPEPATLALFGTGLFGIAARAWRHKRGSHS